MSLILKNSIIFPSFRHQETITFHRKEHLPRKEQRFHTVGPSRRLVSQATRPLNITHHGEIEQPIKLKQAMTPRPHLKIENQGLQDYLDHLNSVRRLKSPPNQVMQQIKNEVELMQTDSQTTIQRFKVMKEQSEKRKKVSLLETVRNPHAQQYKKFTEQLYNLIHNLHLLKVNQQINQDYLNNSRKMFQVVKHLIGVKKNLYRVLIKQQSEELVDFSEISRLCCIRETVFMQGEQRVVEKFDLSLMDDLIFMTDSIKQLLMQNQLMSIKRMSDNIKVEQTEINKLRTQLGMRGENQTLLSSTSPAMMRFKPHIELDNIEQRLGQLNQIPKQARWTSQLLCDIVDKLKQ